MATVQRAKAYTYKDHDIYRFRVNIPTKFLKELGWKQGTEIEFKVKNKKLEISKS